MAPDINRLLLPNMSRFKVVPVDATFRRGRWKCHDFHDSAESIASSTGRNEPLNIRLSAENRESSSESTTSGAVGAQTAVLRAAAAAEADFSNQSSLTSVSSSASSAAARLLAAAAAATVEPGDLLFPFAAAAHGALGNGSSAVVAIDHKIEQAMDLVKTHLMYAVREEVEYLRTKIVDHEKKILRLEAENALLREYVGPEVLSQIQQLHNLAANHPTQPRPSEQ